MNHFSPCKARDAVVEYTPWLNVIVEFGKQVTIVFVVEPDDIVNDEDSPLTTAVEADTAELNIETVALVYGPTGIPVIV